MLLFVKLRSTILRWRWALTLHLKGNIYFKKKKKNKQTNNQKKKNLIYSYKSYTGMQRIRIEQNNSGIHKSWSFGNLSYEILIPKGVLQNQVDFSAGEWLFWTKWKKKS